MTNISAFALQYTNVDFGAVLASSLDLFITEGAPLPAPGSAPQLTNEQVTQLQAQGRIVAGYVNVSVTDDVRSYWDPAWTDNGSDNPGEDNALTDQAPEWLSDDRTNGFGYLADIRAQEWRDIVINQALDLAEKGYGAIFLDDVGRYFDIGTVFQNQGGITVRQYANEMANFVAEIADAVQAIYPDVLIITNTNPYIITDVTGDEAGATARGAYLDAVDAHLLENLNAADLAVAETNLQGEQLLIVNSIDSLPISEEAARELGPLYETNTGDTDYTQLGASSYGATEGNDILTGGDGPNVIDGLGGIDFIDGGAGDDTIFGGSGDDRITVGDGDDTVDAGEGDDFVQILVSAANTSSFASLEGGDGDDDQLIYFFPEAQVDQSLANVTGFEVLALAPSGNSNRQSYTFSDIPGFDFIIASSTRFNGSVNAADITLLPGSSSDTSDTILGGALGGSFTISEGLTVQSYVFYDPSNDRPADDPERSDLLGTTIINQGTILNEVDFDNGDDLYDGRTGSVGGPVTGGAGIDTLLGGSGAESFFGGLDADILNGAGGNDTLDGGSNVDTAVFAGNAGDYTITQTATGVFEVSGADGTDTLTTIEFAQFDDETVRLLPGEGVSVFFDTVDPAAYQTAMNAIRDFDGNALGGDGSWLRIGSTDVNGDGDIDQILVNDAIARFATVGTAPDGLVYFDDHGWAGETRVAGIYIDPLVEAGIVDRFSPNDSQQRFQNDLAIENINRVLGADDYDGDGLQDVYFALTDGTAYLRAIMEADGNIRYANYQSEEQVIEFLNANGYGEETYAEWFDPPPPSPPPVAMDASQILIDRHDVVQTEFFG